MFFVYCILNNLNGKLYIGYTKDPAKRWNRHLRTASGKRVKEKFLLHRAISKYGKSAFTFKVFQEFSNEYECKNAEIYWIKFFNSKNRKYGYNLTDGGEGCAGRVDSEATRQKKREKAIGRKHTEETKELLRKINKGKIPASLEKLKTMHKGIKLSIEHRQKLSKARMGMVFTEEHRKNMSLVRKGHNIGQDNQFYGKTHTEEVKEMSRGENNKKAKLKDDQVISIRQKHTTGNYTQQQLADEYMVSRSQIRRIISGVDWKHLLGNNK